MNFLIHPVPDDSQYFSRFERLAEIDQTNRERNLNLVKECVTVHLSIPDLSQIVIDYLNEDYERADKTHLLDRLHLKDLTFSLRKYWGHLPPHYFFRVEIGTEFYLFSIKDRGKPKGVSGLTLSRWKIDEFRDTHPRPLKDTVSFFLRIKEKKGIQYLSLSARHIYVISAIYPRDTEVKITAFSSLQSASKNEKPFAPVISNKWSELKAHEV